MSLATSIATIEADTINYVPLAKSMQAGIAGVLTNTSLTGLGKALGIVAVVTQASQNVPNADVQAVGGLAGIIDALLLGFLPASATTKTAPVAAAPVATAAAPVAAAVTPAPAAVNTGLKAHLETLFHPNEAAAALAAEQAKPVVAASPSAMLSAQVAQPTVAPPAA